MSTIHYHRYQLTSAGALNAASARRVHEGALIRVDGGVGCLHPWPELGDAPLATQLKLLAEGGSTPLVESALRCAAADGAARAAGRSLFTDPVPESHWLAMPGDDPEEAKGEGFETVKLKLGHDFVRDSEALAKWHGSGFRLRLDYNEVLSLSTFLEFWEELGTVRDAIQLVEDPVKWSPDSWRVLREVGVPAAVDREAESRFHPGDIAILKPAVSDWVPSGDARFLVTSYMDHAIGQCWAAVEASRLERTCDDRLIGCGLLTHRCFEQDAFFERLRCRGPRLLPPEGTGLGFDDLLGGLPWKALD